jgi:hypothetical protein
MMAGEVSVHWLTGQASFVQACLHDKPFVLRAPDAAPKRNNLA